MLSKLLSREVWKKVFIRALILIALIAIAVVSTLLTLCSSVPTAVVTILPLLAACAVILGIATLMEPLE